MSLLNVGVSARAGIACAIIPANTSGSNMRPPVNAVCLFALGVVAQREASVQ